MEYTGLFSPIEPRLFPRIFLCSFHIQRTFGNNAQENPRIKNEYLNTMTLNTLNIQCHARNRASYRCVRKMKFTKNDEAVSPVIGVILMVAITVILAAVIAAFVFGMAGGISSTKSVAATAQQEGATIYVTYQGGQDSLDVTKITAYVPDCATSTAELSAPVVGQAMPFNVGLGGDRNHVVVTATFADASSQVILDTYV